jgi:hypothetical protein
MQKKEVVIFNEYTLVWLPQCSHRCGIYSCYFISFLIFHLFCILKGTVLQVRNNEQAVTKLLFQY